MRRAGAAAVVLALVAGCGSNGGGASAPRSPERAARAPHRAAAVPLRRLVGDTLLLSFAGTRPPGYVLRILRRGDAAGVFLQRENVVSPSQVAAMTGAFRRAGGPGTIVAVDQEGGEARALPWAGPAPAESQAGEPRAVETATRAAAAALRRAGVTVALAPVADVPSAPGAFIAPRAYPGGASAVAARVAAAVRGFRAGGVLPAVKHFPGLGGATRSTDNAPATIAGVPDLAPFRAAIAAGAPLVMASHALYPALDPHAIASQSRPILDGLLRGRLGFRGAIVTDSLEARAVLARSSLQTAALRSLRAGADLLLMTGPGSWIRVDRALTRAARRSPTLRARLAQAAARVARLRRE